MTTLHEAHNQLLEGLIRSCDDKCHEPFSLALFKTLNDLGLQVDRMQLPLHKLGGFRHPLFAVMTLTVLDGQFAIREFTHATLAARAGLSKNVYTDFRESGLEVIRHDLERSDEYSIFKELRAQGLRDYMLFNLRVPASETQALSLSSRNGFPEHIVETLTQLSPILSACVGTLVQHTVAMSVARVYVGPTTGGRVLSGDIVRGSVNRLRAGVLFCDLRDFTGLSQRVDPDALTGLVNEVFERVGDAVNDNEGEILKFIGDAALILFPCEGLDDAHIARRMHRAVMQALKGLERRNQSAEIVIDAGFGGHIGEVAYGNVGARERLDFTVMGATVNLASRLEGQCKAHDVAAVYSQAVAEHLDGCQALGPVALKGIDKPVPLWGHRGVEGK